VLPADTRRWSPRREQRRATRYVGGSRPSTEAGAGGARVAVVLGAVSAGVTAWSPPRTRTFHV